MKIFSTRRRSKFRFANAQDHPKPPQKERRKNKTIVSRVSSRSHVSESLSRLPELSEAIERKKVRNIKDKKQSEVQKHVAQKIST